MKSADNAQKASESLHKKHIGERYIEVFQCSSSDMTLMLMNGISSHRHHNSWINTPYSPRTPPHVPSTFTYPPVSTPPNVPHSSGASPLTMISVPSSPTLSPRVYMTSPGYMSYPSQSYNVFNFSYPTPSVPVEGNMPHTPPVISPAAYDNSAVFFPGPNYQVSTNFIKPFRVSSLISSLIRSTEITESLMIWFWNKIGTETYLELVPI
jgi:hypothetical protein